MFARLLNRSASICWQFVYHTIQKRFQSLAFAKYLQAVHHDDIQFDFGGRYLRIANLRGDLEAIAKAINDRIGAPIVTLHTCEVSSCFWHFPWRLTIDRARISLSICNTFTSLSYSSPSSDTFSPRQLFSSNGTLQHQPPSPVQDSAPQTPRAATSSAALVETMTMISQMVQAAVEHSSITVTDLQVLVALPSSTNTSRDEGLVFTLLSTVLHTSQTKDSSEAISAHLEVGQLSVRQSSCLRTHHSLCATNANSPSNASSLPQTPRDQGSVLSISRPQEGEDSEHDPQSTYVLHCAPGLRADVSWKEKDSAILNLSVPDTFMQISRRLLTAFQHTEAAIKLHRSGCLGNTPKPLMSDFRSPDSANAGLEESITALAPVEKSNWPWLKSAFMRFSGLYGDTDDGLSSSGASSVWGSSPGGTDPDFISMHSYFGLNPEDEDEDELETQSGGLSVDRLDKRVLNKLLQSTDEVKNYLLSELRKEEAEGTADSRAMNLLLSPLVSLWKCLDPCAALSERRYALEQLSQKSVTISAGISSFTVLMDPLDAVRLTDQGGPLYVCPQDSGKVITTTISGLSIKADKDILVTLRDAQTHLILIEKSLTGSKLYTCFPEQLLCSSVSPSSGGLGYWINELEPNTVEQMYSLLAYPRATTSTNVLASLQIEGPKGTAESGCGRDEDWTLLINISVSPVTCCLTDKLRSMLDSLEAMLLPLYRSSSAPGSGSDIPAMSRPASCPKKLDEKVSPKRTEVVVETVTEEAQPAMTLRVFAECCRVIAVQPSDVGAVIGMVSIENASLYSLRNTMSFATDCLVGIGEVSTKHMCLVPMVLTKDPLWFCFDPDIYFDEKSQVFQWTDLPVSDRPAATATLVDSPLPSLQIDWSEDTWREPETYAPETQCSVSEISPSLIGFSPFLILDGKRATSSVYPPSLTSLLRRTYKATTSSTLSCPKDRRQLKVRLLAVILSWPRTFVVGWISALQSLLSPCEETNLGSCEESSTFEDSASVSVRRSGSIPPGEAEPSSWMDRVRESVTRNMELNVAIDKVIAHYIPKDPFTMAVAITVQSINLVCDTSGEHQKFVLTLQDLTTSIYLFNQLLLQWVQHKSCLTKKLSDAPAIKAQVTKGSHNKLRLELNHILSDVNESLLLLGLLVYREICPQHTSEVAPTPSMVMIEPVIHPSTTETPYVNLNPNIPPLGIALWFSQFNGSFCLEIQDVTVSLTSDTVLQTLPVVLDLLRTGDVLTWPSPVSLMWGYELQIHRHSLHLDFDGFHLTRLREATLNIALALRETGTISIAKTLDDAEGAIELRRHGLFTIADYGPGGDQLSSPIEVIRITNLDLRFLEHLLFPGRSVEAVQHDTVRMDLVHMSLSSSTIATLSKSFSQLKDLLQLPVDAKHTLEDLLAHYMQHRTMSAAAGATGATFYTPGLISDSRGRDAAGKDVSSIRGCPSQTARQAHDETKEDGEEEEEEDDDEVWEIDEYYNDLVAELGDGDAWRESVIAAKPPPGPVWIPDFHVEVKAFVCDLRAISMIDSRIISLRADSLTFTLSSVQEENEGFAPLRKSSFDCQYYHIRDATQQSHYEFLCQPYRPPELRGGRLSKAVSVEVAAYRLNSSSSSSSKESSSSCTISSSNSGEYLMIPSEPSSASSMTPAVRPPAPVPKVLVEHSLSITLAPLWLTLDMKTLTAINDFFETLEGLKKLHEHTQSPPSMPNVEGFLQQELLGGETYINAVSTLAFLLLHSGLWSSCIALAASINDGKCHVYDTPGTAEVHSTPLPQHRIASDSASFSGAPEDEHCTTPTAPVLIRSFESQEVLVRFDFYSEGLDHQRLRQGGLIAALNFLAQFCTIEGLEVTFKRLKLEGLMTPKELMVRIVASSVADFDRSQVLRYAVRGTPVLRSLWDISASLKSLMNDALAQSETRPTVAMELTALRQLRQVFDSSEWSVETPSSSSEAASPKATDFTDALESFDYNERVEMILQITRRSFIWVEDQALLSLKALAGQASGSLPFAVRLAEHSGDFLKCLLVESLKISERLMSSCSRRIAAIDTSVSQHLCLGSRLLKRRMSMVESPTKSNGDLGSPRWSFVERGAAGFYEPRTAREGLQDAVVHLRRGWEQAYSIAEQIDFTRRNPWSVRGGDIMAENRAMLMSVVSLEALQAVGRVLPVLLLKPIVTLAEAISSALQGTRNQVDPRQHFERTRSLRAPRISGEEVPR